MYISRTDRVERPITLDISIEQVVTDLGERAYSVQIGGNAGTALITRDGSAWATVDEGGVVRTLSKCASRAILEEARQALEVFNLS